MLHAVIVGIDRYADLSIPGLSCARADAEAVAHLFTRRMEPDERSVRLLVDQQATTRNVRLAVDDVRNAVADDDLVLLYFAGHGSPERPRPQDRPGRYLITHDTELAHIHPTALGMETDVPDWLAQLSHIRLLMIVLDCCFSGAAGGRTVMGPLLHAAGVSMRGGGDRLISLKGLELGRGRVILCAADDNQLAEEDAKSGHGVFTNCFLQALQRNRGAERTVRLTHLYEEIAAGVRLATRGRQEPIVTFIPANGAALPALSTS